MVEIRDSFDGQDLTPKGLYRKTLKGVYKIAQDIANTRGLAVTVIKNDKLKNVFYPK